MATPSTASSHLQDVYEKCVDALNALFGAHAGFRAVHAKGVLCEGTFTPAPDAASLSRAPHFQAAVPVTVRFSDFTGIPNIADTDPNASPRGCAIRFHLPGGADADIVSHSFNGFPVGTAEEFLGFLQALAATSPDSPKPTPIEVFLSTRPRAMAFAVAPKPAPASFASTSYFGINAFLFTNKEGVSRHARYQIRPVAGESYLTDAEAQLRSPDYLFDELNERLSRSSIELKLSAQLAQNGDPVDDGSITWPDDRPQLDVGTIRLTVLTPDNQAAQRRLIYDPIHLADGISLSSDPLPAARSAVYSISYARRNR
jgi:catalase